MDSEELSKQFISWKNKAEERYENIIEEDGEAKKNDIEGGGEGSVKGSGENKSEEEEIKIKKKRRK